MTEKKIEKLTPEQEAQIEPYLEKTLAEGTCTDPCDRPAVEYWLKEVYKERGLTPPPDDKIYWAPSPKAAALLFAELTGEEPQIPQMYGGHELSWLGFNGFLVEVMGLKWDGDLTPFLEMARHSGWWMPFDDMAILCERHNVLKTDAEHNLHCEDGPAVAFPDGWGLYFWHGTAVPEEWIMDKANVDPHLALNHENIEQRRCLAEIIGWDKILEILDPAVVDEDPDPEIGILLEVYLPDSGKEKFLKVRCGTGRDFVLPVPPEMKTALEANAWTYNIPPQLFKPEIRT